MDRFYVINVFVDTKEIEILDRKNNNIFLKRSPYPDLDLTKFYLGNGVVISGR